ncbi:hypothetical protein BDW68DRAFT_7270 [Aspergillus falconensis]
MGHSELLLQDPAGLTPRTADLPLLYWAARCLELASLLGPIGARGTMFGCSKACDLSLLAYSCDEARVRSRHCAVARRSLADSLFPAYGVDLIDGEIPRWPQERGTLSLNAKYARFVFSMAYLHQPGWWAGVEDCKRSVYSEVADTLGLPGFCLPRFSLRPLLPSYRPGVRLGPAQRQRRLLDSGRRLAVEAGCQCDILPILYIDDAPFHFPAPPSLFFCAFAPDPSGIR